MENIEQLAKEVTMAQDRLELAKRRLLAALGEGDAKTTIAPNRAKSPAAPKGLPVSQQVLQALAAAPAGLSRSELRAKIQGGESAMHSFLKKASSAKKIVNKDGKWFLGTTPAKKKGPRP
jgi:hypothetical protein